MFWGNIFKTKFSVNTEKIPGNVLPKPFVCNKHNNDIITYEGR